MNLTPQTVIRDPSMPPLGQQLADRMREAILKGDVHEGAELPSIEAIGSAIEASRPVVRTALDILEHEGLIVRHAGSRTKVAHRPKPRILNDSRYRDVIAAKRAGEDLVTSAFAEEHGVGLDSVIYSPISYRREPASAEDALRLGIKSSSKVLRRHWVKCIVDEHGNARPKEIQTSIIALKRVTGTDFMNPDVQPVPGGILAELLNLGYTSLRWAEEEWFGRPPTADERSQLQMETVDWVSDQLRVFVDDDGIPIEYSRTIRPMAATILRFRADLSREPQGRG